MYIQRVIYGGYLTDVRPTAPTLETHYSANHAGFQVTTDNQSGRRGSTKLIDVVIL